MSLIALQTLVTDLVRERDGVVTDTQRDAAIADAVLQYSADRPRIVVVDVTFDGGTRVAVPADWEDGFSQLLQLELPIGETPPATIPADQVATYRTPTDLFLELRCGRTHDGAARLTHTALHIVSVSTDTTRPADCRSIAALAAADLCDQLATFYATEGMPSIGADVTDYRSKSEKFASRANAFRKQYRDTLGIADRRLEAASAVVELQRRDSLGGQLLFHRSRR